MVLLPASTSSGPQPLSGEGVLWSPWVKCRQKQMPNKVHIRHLCHCQAPQCCNMCHASSWAVLQHMSRTQLGRPLHGCADACCSIANKPRTQGEALVRTQCLNRQAAALVKSQGLQPNTKPHLGFWRLWRHCVRTEGEQWLYSHIAAPHLPEAKMQL